MWTSITALNPAFWLSLPTTQKRQLWDLIILLRACQQLPSSVNQHQTFSQYWKQFPSKGHIFTGSSAMLLSKFPFVHSFVFLYVTKLIITNVITFEYTFCLSGKIDSCFPSVGPVLLFLLPQAFLDLY